MKRMRFIIYNYVFMALTITRVFCECGNTERHGQILIANGLPVELGTFPWHVGVYHVDWESGEIDHICGGSLIAPDLVISAAHCFYDEDKRRINDPLDYAVAAGKIQRSYYEFEDGEQKSQVKWIHVPYAYNHMRGNYANDIAVLRLHRSFAETQFVSPVCIEWRKEYIENHLRNGTIGRVTGWGLTEEWMPSEELRKMDLPYIDRDYCRRGAPEDFLPFVTNDKICAGYLNGSSVCKGDSGGGYCFQSGSRWYLRGVVSVNAFPGHGTCNNNYYSGFTNVGRYFDWIREFLPYAEERDPTTGSCFLPKQPEGGRFEQHSCGESYDHAAGSRVPIDSVLIYWCNEGYTLRGNEYSICKDEGWTPPPTCVSKPCPALRLANGDVLCKYNGEIVPCESAMAPGTRATLECKDYYKISPALKEITCLEGGVWNSRGFQCVPECGIAESTETLLIVNWSGVMHGSFPWFVGIYYRSSKDLINPGTLIKPDLVVSRAIDFYDAAMRDGGKPVTPDQLVVLAGKYYSSYDKFEPYAQMSLVKKIHKHSNYTGKEGRYANNIALLRLKTPFTMSKLVRPVCLDRRSGIAEGFSRVGKISGWYYSGTYFEVEGRFVNHAACSSSVGSYYRQYLTSDKTCWQSMANEHRKFAYFPHLGGIYAEKNNKWYLVGVPSLLFSNILISTNVDTSLSRIAELEID